jgi:hypothetical protein
MAYTDHSLQRDLTLLTEAQRQALEDNAEGRDPPVPAPPMATEAQCLAADEIFRRQEESEEEDAERPVVPEKS